jgi:hypothetical protein
LLICFGASPHGRPPPDLPPPRRLVPRLRPARAPSTPPVPRPARLRLTPCPASSRRVLPLPPASPCTLHRGQSSKGGGGGGWCNVFVALPPQWKPFAVPSASPPEPTCSTPPRGDGAGAPFGAYQTGPKFASEVRPLPSWEVSARRGVQVRQSSHAGDGWGLRRESSD